MFDLNKYKNKLLFLPLGGSGEIGMNFNLYYYKGKWLVVDCGSGFASDQMPGVDLIIPDISYIVQHRKDIAGIVITHAHEDHLGSVQHLWEALDAPIYTTTFTANFLKAKLSERFEKLPNEIIEIKQGGDFSVDPFDIEFVPLCHSAPEMQAMVLKTEQGNIFHTGDWKFDEDPLIGEANDEGLLRSYGDKGVLAVIGDSTNVFNEDYSGSESKLKDSLLELVSSCKKMVVVTTFASNLARLESLIKIGEQSGRRVIFAGRSLHRIYAAAKASGYLKDIPKILDERDIDAYDRGSIMVIATGCQGEPMAALPKMANGQHPRIKIAPGDTVIFSSKIIPGNDKKIFKIFNQLARNGIEVMTEKDHFVHVSGHPGKKELRRLYELLRPDILIPVHGEHVHMREHAKLGREVGVKTAIEVENGDVVSLSKDSPCKLGKVQAGELAVYGNYLLHPESKILRVRRYLQNDGALFITLILSKKYNLHTDPVISAPGYLDNDEDKDLIIHLKGEIASLLHMMSPSKKKPKIILEEIEKSVKSKVKSIVNKEIRKVPVIQVFARVV
jgi:ribonuclease J